MRNLLVLFLLILFALTTIAQTPKPTPKNSKKTVSTKNAGNEKEDFDKAAALKDANERIKAFQKFIENYPESKEKERASEYIVIARATLADEKLRSGDAAGGIELFKLAASESAKPVSDKFFTEVLLQIPNTLFYRGQRKEAVEVARLLEEKSDGNARQTLALATFYLGLENVSEAKRLADIAAQIDPNLPAVYQTLGLVHRLSFDFEASAAAYQKALELAADSIVSKRSLAEIKRAVGKPLEAVALYREILSKNETDAAARTGLILALFDADNRAEAETEMQKSLAENPNNLFLLVGAAYWYATHEESAKAIEYAQKAIIVEPRYTWAHIALARGLIQQKRFSEAEKAMLTARAYGNFPTLDYEYASVLIAGGYYREAAELLQKKFSVKDNLIAVQLGGRVLREAKSFPELIAPERRAGIFQFVAADNAETSARLKSLLNFIQTLSQKDADEAKIIEAADEFVKGDDKMKLHRQLFAAERLLEKKSALPKVLELTKAAIGGVESALDVPSAATAVLADELYEKRLFAAGRNDIIVVPEIPRRTLSNILRGRIEDLTGAAFLQENKTAEAIIHLKRAIGILPENSAWWRDSVWRYGAALEVDGKSKEALGAYIKSYTNSEENAEKYAVIETLYQKINGSVEGLEAQIGAKPVSTVSTVPVKVETQNTELPKPTIQSTPETKTEVPPTESEVTQPIAETKIPPPVSETEVLTKSEPAPTPETKTESPAIETKTETVKTETAPNETKPEIKQTETEIKQTPENSPKSIFEPVIISVPKVEPLKKTSGDPKPDVPVEEKKSVDESVEKRPRLIVEEKVVAPCKLSVNQETVSIMRGTGSLAVILNFEGEGDFLKEIKAISSSPVDVEAVFEPEIGASSNSAIFLIKSISQKTGEFILTFESACGKKEINVTVR